MARPRRWMTVPRSGVAAATCLAVMLSACSQEGATRTRSGPVIPLKELAPVVVVTSTTLTALPEPPKRVLLMGDSTLLAVLRYDAFEAVQGFESVFDAQSCRTLGVPSCGDKPRPTNSVEAISNATGAFDTIVIMAGYDEWWTSFPSSFDAVVAASRAKGATRIVWLTYREGVGYTAPDGATANEAFVKNNQTLRDKVASGAYPDVVLADWFGYTATATGWLASDGIHLTGPGALGVGDYISRQLAFLDGRPCPQPWVVGGPIDDPCPNPDLHGPVADIRALYP